MNSLQLITKIKSRLAEITELTDEILTHNNNLLPIEKEVLKKNCAELYDLLLKLKTNEEQIIENVAPKVETPKAEESIIKSSPILELVKELPKLEEIVIEDLPSFNTIIETAGEEHTLNSIAEIIVEEEVIIDEPEIIPVVEEPAVVIQTPIVENKIETHKPADWKPELKIGRTVMPEIPKEEPKSEPFLSVEKLVLPNKSEDELSFNDRIAKNIERYQISDKTIEPKIDNLKTAISLNKKIAFVNELFKENVVDYAKNIDRINNALDINEAMLYFSELKTQYNWQATNELVIELEKLIQRRF
ncbi:MAG: hypothetical protein NTU43_00885 [Bacteroidetes bacterium]|nr:hypothetical protein [Bacteroidota bacterium]